MESADCAAVVNRRALGGRPSQARVPVPLTSFLARDQEIREVSALLRREDVRLLTLTGPGGVGKTRLAIAIAHTIATVFPDGVAFVGLAPIREASVVGSALAHAVIVAEASDELPLTTLVAGLQNAALLLVLDNFEHVVAAAPLVVELLAQCPGLTVLITSRSALHVSGEREYPVSPLSLPAVDMPLAEDIANAPAVRLFVERATAVDPGFELTDDNAAAVAAICGRLDGLPLAIELAAARGKVLPPALLLPRLARRLPLLTGGPRDVPARLQTMHAAIAWSHDLLTPDEQVVFRRLGVFVGGFTLDAAEMVCRRIEETTAQNHAPAALDPALLTNAFSILDGIVSLMDKSLLQWSESREHVRRLHMLETIREFALEQVGAAEERDTVQGAHAAHFVAFAEEGYPNHFGSFTGIAHRFQQLEVEQANLRAALTFMADSGDAEGVLELAGALPVFWQHRGHLREGQHWLEWGLSHTAELPTDYRGRALVGLGLIRWAQGQYEQAALLARAALDIAEQLNNTEIAAHAIHVLGLTEEAQERWEQAGPLFEQALGLWRKLSAQAEEAVTLHLLSGVAYGLGNNELCASRAETSLALFRAIGHTSGAAMALCRLARLARDRREDRGAALTYNEALQLWVSIDDRWSILTALAGLAELASARGESASAATLLGSIDALQEKVGGRIFYSARINCERAATEASAVLGAARYTDLRVAGRALGLDAAVVLAKAVASRVGQSGNGLTSRQAEVLRLLIGGRSDREIAATLFLGHRTVEDHVSNIIGKLGVANRTEAVAVAVRDSLV